MPDRIIRDELLESDRWLDLPTDASRLAFVGFLLVCDDFGNLEGGPRRLFRLLHKFTQIKTEEASAAIVDALMACDLVRRYEAEGRELFHIPRFRTHRNYRVRRYPASPWCLDDLALGKHVMIRKQGLAKNIVTTSLRRSNDVVAGVGVGEGVGVIPSVKSDPRNRLTWDSYAAAYSARYRVPPVSNAKVNTNIAQLVKRLGNEAPAVAAFYLTHNEPFYVKKRHAIGLLLNDAEGLRTQWKTGTKATSLEARSAEKVDAVTEQLKRIKGEQHAGSHLCSARSGN
jgi:hypothetical protein